VNVVIFKEN